MTDQPDEPKITTENVKPYQESMRILALQYPKKPQFLIGLACAITQKKEITGSIDASAKLCKYLIDADHTSVFEHVSFTFLMEGVSRSFLAQITRHRMASYTSGSQHYQDYRDYPFAISSKLNKEDFVAMSQFLSDSLDGYVYMVDKCMVKPEEARQLLPNAATLNLMWTINVRSLINFLNVRLCNRNTEEMRLFANAILQIGVMHLPEVFNWVGPQCFMLGKCKQGPMQCKQRKWR